MTFSRWRALFGLFCVLAMLATACGGDNSASRDLANEESSGGDGQSGGGESAGGGEELSGTIDIDGSSTVAPLTEAIAEEYAKEQPGVQVNLAVSGTGGGFEAFCTEGGTQISNASRPIKEEEVAACEEAGIDYTEIRVGTDALTVVTNAATDFVDCLTFDELATIWGAEEPAETWQDVNPEFPAEPITIFAPDTDSGTYDFFTEEVLGDPEEGAETPRQDYQASADDNIIAQGIIGTPASWGYFGFAYFQNIPEQVKALGVDSGDGCVEPSLETAEAGDYPLARPLFIYVNNEAITDPAVAGFTDFYLENVNAVIQDVGYIPAPEDALSESRSELQALTGGGGGESGRSSESAGSSESES